MNKLNFFQNRPKAAKIDVDAYLSRINLTREEATLRYLQKLQKRHLLSIPFENLDIHYGRKIILDYPAVFEKVIKNKRGGFCHELNGLFYHLLYHLGFNCYIISAQVWDKEKQLFGRPFEHMAIIVSINDEKWLVDVGFGEGLISPFKVKKGEVRMDYTRYWKIDTDADENFVLKVSDNATHFESRLQFTLEEKQLIQFMEICDFQQTSPDSVFTQKKMITQLTPEGRVTLTDRTLKVSALAKVDEMDVLHEDDFLSKLEHHFGITYRQLVPFN